MKNTTLLQGAIVAGLLISRTPAAPAQDWPQWRGANRDARAVSFNAPKTWPAQLTQKWKQTVGIGDSTPALAGDRLFVFSRVDTEENLICLNAADGTEIWRQKYTAPKPGQPSGQDHSGPRSSPTVGDGKVISFGVTGILTCCNASDGTVLWQKKDATNWPRFYASSSPLIEDGMCVAQIGGPADGGVAAYDLKSGDEKWRWTNAGPDYASPAVMTVAGTKTVVALTVKSVAGIALADGKALWEIPFPSSGMAHAVTPIVDGDTLIYGGAGRGLHALKIARQGDAFTATESWAAPTVSPQFNTAVLKDGFLYGLTTRSTFFCVNAETGAVAWVDATSKGQPAGYGSVVDAGSVLLALTPKSQLYVIQPGDKAYTELTSYKVADSPTYAYPVVSGGRIFIHDKDSVTLYTMDQP